MPPKLVSLLVLKILLLATFLLISNHGVAERLQEFWQRGGGRYGIGFLIYGGIWLMSLAAVVIAAFLPAFWMRLFWSIPVGLSAFAGILIFEITAAHLTFFDVVLYWAERSHLGDIIEFYFTWLAVAGLKTLVGIVAILLPPIIRLRYPRLLFPAPFAPIAVIAAMILVLEGHGTKALPVQFSGVAMSTVLAVSDPFGESARRQPVQLVPSARARTPHVFLIVDEGVRGDFLDINYPRDVTPYLLSQRERIANFGYAISGNNCSFFSNLMLRYGAVRERLAESLRTYPSIWSYAKAAGYRSVYIDAQKSARQLQNGMTVAERNQIDDFEQPDHLPPTERDFFVAERLLEIARLPQPHFVYVNKRGAHFPFAGKYPSAVFVPDMEKGEAVGTNRERLVNSYKNALRYNLEGFFLRLLGGDLENTFVVYTSDHGINLMEHGIVTHCRASDPHEFEALVPLLTMSDDPEWQRRFLEAAVINHDRTSHFQVFPTLLELFGYDPAEIRAIYGAGLLDPLDDADRAFTFSPVVGGATLKTRWKSVPSDLRAFVQAGRLPLVRHAVDDADELIPQSTSSSSSASQCCSR